MFIPPPPPKYPTAASVQPPPVVPGMPLPSNETMNVLKQPTDSEYHLVVGEGIYVLRDDWFLSTPPPHPSEAPIINPNPLATTVLPPTAGTKLSIVITSGKKAPPRILMPETEKPDFSNYSLKEAEKEHRLSHETESSGAGSQSQAASHGSDRAPAFGANNSLIAPPALSKDVSKRRKPKNNIIKSNSTFISRVITHESLQKRLQEREPDGIFAFANINRAFQWLDLTTSNMFKSEHLTKILLTKAHFLCHDINAITKSPSHIDLVMGSSAADIIWYEPFSQKYHRINKNGIINSSPISEIRWIPGSDNLFLASHMDGTLVVYDKEREDGEFVSEEAEHAHQQPVNGESQPSATSLHIHKSVNSKNQRTNPVASWKISNQKINAFAFSPDSRHLAVVSEDGSLRVIDYLKETLLDLYTSYYGGFTCVCWSPDGRYILTGGQDDLVSIWSLSDRALVARCPGHHSWVSAVAFDPWRCDKTNYRFGSVGDDCRLLLWDFNVNMLHRPKAALGRQRGSLSSTTPINTDRQKAESLAATRLRSNSSLSTSTTRGDESVEHAVESRTLTADLPPVMSKSVDPCPLSGLSFQEDGIITSCIMGHVKVWDRPKEAASNESQITISASSKA